MTMAYIPIYLTLFRCLTEISALATSFQSMLHAIFCSSHSIYIYFVFWCYYKCSCFCKFILIIYFSYIEVQYQIEELRICNVALLTMRHYSIHSFNFKYNFSWGVFINADYQFEGNSFLFLVCLVCIINAELFVR
jgi:hypothetical protein